MQPNPDPPMRICRLCRGDKRRQELHPDKTATRHYFVNRGSLKLPEHWMTHIWIGLCIDFLQYCTKKFSDRAPLVSFARQRQGCRETIPGQQVLQSLPQALHVPNFPPLGGRLHADSWLLSLIARQPPLEIEKVFCLYHQDHGVCVLYKNIDSSAICSPRS